MDSLEVLAGNAHRPHTPKIETKDSIILESIVKPFPSPAAKVSFSVDDLPKALTVSTQEIIDKLNNILAEGGSQRIEALKPDQHTPEATADRIVKGATAFFDTFAAQNPELEGEDLINAFMDTIRSGIDQGYSEAFEILDGLGAFEVDGVQAGIEKTKELIEAKLLSYENAKRQELGLDPTDIEKSVAEDVKTDILQETKERLSVEVVA